MTLHALADARQRFGWKETMIRKGTKREMRHEDMEENGKFSNDEHQLRGSTEKLKQEQEDEYVNDLLFTGFAF